jgi:hypothetical protein
MLSSLKLVGESSVGSGRAAIGEPAAILAPAALSFGDPSGTITACWTANRMMGEVTDERK